MRLRTMKPTLPLLALLLAPLASLHAAETNTETKEGSTLLVMAPRVSVVERDGITGAGQVVAVGNRLIVFYPNHPDDFGASGGMGASISENGGATWTAQPDDWPMPKMVDAWADRLRDGSLLYFGIRWAPDPKKRGELTAKDVPADAYATAVSTDQGRTWQSHPAVLDCPPEFGVIARPLPHIFEDENGVLFMPVYAWGKSGNHALLLTSADRGKLWKVLSSITSTAAMAKAGAPVTTPWLETTVSPTKNGDWLAIVRTGSSPSSSLVAVRSSDRGKNWSAPEKLSFGGKLPTLQLLADGMLALLTAHTKNHCRLYFSTDGGRTWSTGHILTSQSGGNAGMTVSGDRSLLVITPANRRIDAWQVSIQSTVPATPSVSSPDGITFASGVLSWRGNAARYRIKPVLVKTAAGYEAAELLPHADIVTKDLKLDLRRQLLIGATYVFEVCALDAANRPSAPSRSEEFLNR